MKILVISNNCFAKNDSNGRILGLLFKRIPVDDVAQFYIVDGTNDFDVCSNYYLVNDSMAIRSLYSSKKVGRIITKPLTEISNIQKMSKYRAKYGRNSLTMLIRNFIWMRFRWWNADFEKWLKCVNPDVILLQCGDAPFMYEIACRISDFLNIPIVEFNTEFYYFEKDNYINSNDPVFLFRYYKHKLCKSFKKTIERAKVSIYNSKWMKENYYREFGKPSEFIYQSSAYRCEKTNIAHEIPHITYIGSLGFRRYEALAEIADAIYSINPKWRLSIYGMLQNEETKELFERTPGIDYKGVVPYDEAKKVISDSDVLVLAENMDIEISKNTAYGFSTKITDYLFSGIPILAYGPSNNVGMNYLKDNGGAMVINNKNRLKDSLCKLVLDVEFRNNLSHRALEIAHENHDADTNSAKFISVLEKFL